MTPADLGIAQHQVRPWITTDKNKWSVEMALRGTVIRFPNPSHSKDSGLLSPQASSNNSSGDSGMTKVDSKVQTKTRR